VRSARRLATALRAPWTAVFVETHTPLGEAARERADRHLRLAERLGGQTVTLSGERVADEVAAYARLHNFTKVVIGKPDQSRFREIMFGSLVDDLIRRSGDIDVYVIRGDDAERESPTTAPPAPKRFTDWRGYGWAVGTVAAATAIGWPIYHHFAISNSNVLMLYLLGVLWIASRYSRGAATLAALLSVAAFDVCFVPPYLTLAVSDQQYLFTFVVMLITALLIGRLTNRIRLQADAARQREHRTQTLLALSRDLAGAKSVEEIGDVAVRHISESIDARPAILLPDAKGHLVAHSKSLPLDEREMAVAQWVQDHGQPAGAGTGTLAASAGVYLPMRGSRGPVGVVALTLPASTHSAEAGLRPPQQQMIEALVSQTALALERAALAEEARRAWERVEAEFVRNTLLSGVSHDLRTPLAAITGSASTLADAGETLSPADRLEMLQTIRHEAERMERLVNNLLAMTRLESGGLVLNREWQPLQEVIGTTLHHMHKALHDRQITVTISPALPLVRIDAVAIEQVLVNLLHNALEYTPPSSPIEISADPTPDGWELCIADRGPGLPPGTERRVFEKFFRARPVAGQAQPGIGLGLALCRGIVEAHGGTISATNRPTGGAAFRIRFPQSENPPAIPSDG
jgi:two-component system sensor histidine kinase KdpD